MNDAPEAQPVLVFTYGNPSRGDDALGPAMYDLLHQNPMDRVELQTDFQLQIEHALDFAKREFILFIDAGTGFEAPFELRRLMPEKDDSYTTHSMSPSSLLAVYRQLKRREPPQAWLLTIRGYDFGLGKALSENALSNLFSAHNYLVRHPPWQRSVSHRGSG